MMNKPESISSPSSSKSLASARKRVLRPSVSCSTTKSAWALASERFTPPPPIKVCMTPNRFNSTRHSDAHLVANVTSPSKGPFTCPNGGKRRKTENFHLRKSVHKRKMSVQTDEEYLDGYRSMALHKTEGKPVDKDERDDTNNMTGIKLFHSSSSPFRRMDGSKRETSERDEVNAGNESTFLNNERDEFPKDDDTSPTNKSRENPLQKHIEHSLYRLENEVRELSTEVKSKNDQIDRLAKDTQKQKRRLSIERNLRIQAELKEITASHAAYAKASEEARKMAVEQVRLALSPVPKLKNKNSLSFRKHTENQTRKNGVNGASNSHLPEYIGCRSEEKIDFVVSLEAKIKQQEEDLVKRGEMFEEEVIKLKSNHQKVVEGMKRRIHSLEVSNMRLRQQQINDVGRLKQELRLLRETQHIMKASSGIEIKKATDSIVSSCETLRTYVVEEVTESTVSAEVTIKDLVRELEEYRNENALLKDELDSSSRYQDNSNTDAEGLRDTAEASTRQVATCMSSMSWKDFTVRFREVISNKSGKLPSEELKLDEAGMVTVSNLMKELSFNSDSPCQKTKGFEMITVQKACEECGDSDEDSFLDAFESH